MDDPGIEVYVVSPVIEQELRRHLATLPAQQQRQVLDFARALSAVRPRGDRGSSLLAFAGSIPAEELADMRAAIEADCERLDADGW
jgi:hypothetical protein